MSQFKHTSWGRTRSPKNLTGTQGGEVTAETAVSALTGITASTKGYATENQRYLHVLIEETATGGDAGDGQANDDEAMDDGEGPSQHV